MFSSIINLFQSCGTQDDLGIRVLRDVCSEQGFYQYEKIDKGVVIADRPGTNHLPSSAYKLEGGRYVDEAIFKKNFYVRYARMVPIKFRGNLDSGVFKVASSIVDRESGRLVSEVISFSYLPKSIAVYSIRCEDKRVGPEGKYNKVNHLDIIKYTLKGSGIVEGEE